jgi:hypothetical protein
MGYNGGKRGVTAQSVEVPDVREADWCGARGGTVSG